MTTIKTIIAETKKNYPNQTIEIYTHATANGQGYSYHTDRCRPVYSTDMGDILVGDENTEWEVIDTTYMDSEDMNRTIYANSSYTAEEDEEIVAVFVKEIIQD